MLYVHIDVQSAVYCHRMSSVGLSVWPSATFICRGLCNLLGVGLSNLVLGYLESNYT